MHDVMPFTDLRLPTKCMRTFNFWEIFKRTFKIYGIWPGKVRSYTHTSAQCSPASVGLVLRLTPTRSWSPGNLYVEDSRFQKYFQIVVVMCNDQQKQKMRRNKEISVWQILRFQSKTSAKSTQTGFHRVSSPLYLFILPCWASKFIASFPGPAQLCVTCSAEKR